MRIELILFICNGNFDKIWFFWLMDYDFVKCCGFELELDIIRGFSFKGGEFDGGIRFFEGDYIV